ncbi:MAG TPA: LysR family transcriptional regulator [Polyangiaceae bacterium]|nr:LysR family transcriptional regulator [Polyangiaceae bacterium]
MHGLKRILGLWPYLPAFRVTAELEHVTRAAERLGVSPSAVSRAVTELEREVGVALFSRSGRGVTLTEAGATFLRAVRTAMRIVDDGLVAARDQSSVGTVRVAACEPFVTCFAPATFARLRRTYADLVPSLVRASESATTTQLLDGSVDVAVQRVAATDDDLVSDALVELETGLYGRADDDPAGAATRSFVDVALPASVPALVGADRPRKVALVAPDFDVALSACLGGGVVAVLPVLLAREANDDGRLRRIAASTRPLTLFAVRRRPLEGPSRAEWVIDAARVAITQATEG